MLNKIAAAARRIRFMVGLYNDPANGGPYTMQEASEINASGGLLVGTGEKMQRIRLSDSDLQRAWKRANKDAD